MPKLSRPRAVLFDMGGVLLESADGYDEAGFAKSFPDGLPEDAPLDWFFGMSQTCIERFTALKPPRPAMDIRPIITEWLGKRGVAAGPDTVERWHWIMQQWEARPIFDFVRPTLEQLRAMGLRMGVVSNTLSAAAYLREHFEREGILEYFDVTVFSAEFGINKPGPAIFAHALESIGVAPAGAWYVGDKPQRDICGAHRAGMTAVLVDSKHAHRVEDAPENRPDLRLHDMSELPGVLRSLD